jgi:hypothetical protein
MTRTVKIGWGEDADDTVEEHAVGVVVCRLASLPEEAAVESITGMEPATSKDAVKA